MPDFSARTPIEPTKLGDYLHDRTRIPASPRPGTAALARRNIGLVLGILFALGAFALVVQTRASWESHRDWVTPFFLTLAVPAGLALGHLLARGKVKSLGAFSFFFLFFAAFTIANYWRGQVTVGDDRGRDALTILATFAGTFAIVAVLGALIWVEARNPTKAPPPAM